jgi:diguanylate cyclase (GGDEF)-like protein
MIHVLLVEDNPNDALLMQRLLRSAAPERCEMVHQNSMERATKHLASEPVDVVLLDLGLPDANGLDAVSQILAAAPHIPVVVLTGRNDERLAAQALRAGAQDFLVKGEIGSATVLRALHYAIERKGLEERLFLEQERAQITLNAIGDAVICADNSGRITFMNSAAETMTGVTLAACRHRPISETLRLTDPGGAGISLGDSIAAMMPDQGGRIAASAILNRDSGRDVPVEYIASSILGRSGAVIGAVYALRDMSATRILSLKLAHMAQHDSLTGLPNRVLLSDRIKHAIAIAPRHLRQPGVLFLDLDGFKHVNDSLGHAIGDKLLQSVAKRLTNCVRTSDTVSRLGGDEFVILLAEMAHPEDAAIAANRMLEAVSEPHHIDQHELHISTSIGVSLFPNDGTDAETLIKNADTAMYQAKEQGRKTYRFFEPAMNLRAVERQSIEEGLRRAVERNELSLHYQPKIDLATGRISSAEALVRWNNKTRGNTPPVQFISVAEDSGLIVPVGKWVLREACRQAKAWSSAGMDLQTIAVNVSAMEFQNDHFLQNVFSTLEETGLEPEKLELELTESVLMKRTGAAAATLKSLRAEGIRLAIDDFGTGYSSLSYLTRFPVDTLKIDQSFIRQITGIPAETTIVTAVLSMARSLNLRVVAEGVETAGELEFLQAHHCDEAQGYYFSRPLPAPQFQEMLHAYA